MSTRSILGLTILALAGAPAVRAQPAPGTPAAEALAEQLFAQGKRDYDLGEYAAATKAFKEAYRLTGEPLLLFNVAQAQRKQNDCAGALNSYRSYLRNLPDMERYMQAADPRVVLYVNQSVRNFQLMRYGRAMHVFISHGESEKGYMSSGQLRAYDFAFIAGQAAYERIENSLPNYDPAVRTRAIGRPQLDFLPTDRSGSGRPTVFYAPTLSLIHISEPTRPY